MFSNCLARNCRAETVGQVCFRPAYSLAGVAPPKVGLPYNFFLRVPLWRDEAISVMNVNEMATSSASGGLLAMTLGGFFNMPQSWGLSSFARSLTKYYLPSPS
jgi:hypothetical protein